MKMNKKIKIISIAVVLFSIVSAVYAHTYVAVYGDNNGNTIGITSMDYSNIINVSVNCGFPADFYFIGNDDTGSCLYKHDGDVISISRDAQTMICGNVYTGQTFVLYLRKVSQLN
jgi:hypothetical protein